MEIFNKQQTQASGRGKSDFAANQKINWETVFCFTVSRFSDRLGEEA